MHNIFLLPKVKNKIDWQTMDIAKPKVSNFFACWSWVNFHFLIQFERIWTVVVSDIYSHVFEIQENFAKLFPTILGALKPLLRSLLKTVVTRNDRRKNMHFTNLTLVENVKFSPKLLR